MRQGGTRTTSEHAPDAELERVSLRVLVARQHPRHEIALIDLEEHDLISGRGVEAAGKRQVDAVGNPFADRDPRRRVDSAALRAVRIDE